MNITGQDQIGQMRIEKVIIIDAQKNNEPIVFGPIDGGKSVIIIGDQLKSSWLKAISFASGYSNEIDSLPREFHNFNGSVEITFTIAEPLFNGTDPNQTQKRLIVRRTIHDHQIDYAIDGSDAKRVDVKNLLQTYGFAENYPFQFSIECDDLTSIEMSNDKSRFKWLENCCGVDEYRAKKSKSLRLLRETKEHIQRVDESLEKIKVQLNIFASNEAQQTYQKLVNREKELTHFQRQHRIQKIRDKIQELNLKMKTNLDQIATVKNDMIQCGTNGTKIRREIKSILEQINGLRVNEQKLQRDIDEYECTKAELVEHIGNLQNVIEKGALAEDLTMHEKQIYEKKMDETRTRMSELDEGINAIDEEKEKIEQELDAFDRQIEEISVNCQQNQRLGTQFQSIAQRNEYLSEVIKKTKNAISRENRKKNKMIAELQPDTRKLENLRAAAAMYNERLTELNAKEESDSFYQQQAMLNDLEIERSELIEQSEELTEKSKNLELNLEQVYDELRSQIGDSIFEGIKSMNALMQKNLSNPFREQYNGLVIENFTCNDPMVAETIATLMGKYLFYHIVDTPKTATRIISELNKANLPGEVNFFALDTIDCDDWAQSDNIKNFIFDAKYHKVFARIFGEMPSNVQDLWSKSADEIRSVASCFPDVIEKDGVLTATNSTISVACNPIELYEKHQNLVELDEATRYERSENSYRLDATISSIDETKKSLTNQHSFITSIQDIESSLAKTIHQIELYENHIAAKQAELQKYENKVTELTDTKNRCENEMKLNLLSPDEEMAIERVQVLINDKKTELNQVHAEINELKAKRDNIAEFFDQTLMSRYSAIEESSREYTNATMELNRKQLEQSQYAENQMNAESDLNAVRRQIVNLQKLHESKKVALRDLDKLKLDLVQRQKSLYIELQQSETLKENLAREVNQLIAFKPPDVAVLQNQDIVEMSEEEVRGQLEISRRHLQTYQNTQSFDLNILDKFEQDRKNLVHRRNELTKIGKKILEKMESLDSNINTSIESTFDYLSENFVAVFKRFVPNGSARLHAINEINVPETGTNNNADNHPPNVSQMAGIKIFAQFPDDIEEPFDNLIGQKRRVVAFAFIVAMQQLCSAPFYLFDCIDELFVEPYFTSLINYFNELSEKAQIIITSNRQSSLGGLNFIDNIFQSTVTKGTHKIQQIPCGQAASP